MILPDPTMTYEGYMAAIDFDNRDLIFVGRVLGMRDKISFHGTSVDELTQAFHDTIESNPEQWARQGKPLDREYSGVITLRTSPHLHRMIALAAERSGQSMNKWVETVVKQSVGEYTDASTHQ